VEWGLNMLTTGAFTLREAERRAKQVQQKQWCAQEASMLVKSSADAWYVSIA
jgi:hypothetical protein